MRMARPVTSHDHCTHMHICRVGQNHICLYIYGVLTVLLAGKSLKIRAHTVVYGVFV